MENRLVITALCVAAVGYACSPWIRSQNAPSPAGVDSARAAPLAMSLGSGPILPVSAHAPHATRHVPHGVVATTLDVMRAGSRVNFALRVMNNTARTVELDFPDARTHDFVVLDVRGDTVWHWSAGRLFTQTMQSKAVASRDTLTLAEGWDAHGAHGTYTAVALLPTGTHPVERRVAFTLP
jgi:hypothetical protein